jgi:glycosyl transferase, family 25
LEKDELGLEMKQIIEYFDRSYVINLLDRTDRRRQAEQEFRRAGINIPNEKVKFYTASRPADKGKFSDIGTRGCFESHRNVLELANREQLPNVLIFEDDVSFRNVGGTFEQEVIAQLSHEDWDVVYFGYSIPPDDALTGPLMRWPKDIRGAHFYAVNGKFIRTMLQYMHECELRPRDHPDGGPMPADGAYNHVRYVIPGVNLFLSVPNLAHQRSSRTDIAQTHVFDGLVWLRPIMRGARAIKHRLRMALDKNKLRRQLEKK